MASQLIPCHNRIVRDRILQRLSSAETQAYEEVYHEFDDCKYLVQCTKDGRMRISFALPQLSLEFRSKLVCQSSIAELQDAYSEVATVCIPPEPGYDATLQLDVPFLSRLSKDMKEWWAGSISSIRLLLSGRPLRRHFDALGQGCSTSGPLESHCHKAGQVYFIKPYQDHLALIFPIRFVTAQESAIGCTYLQEMIEARRAPSAGLAPSVMYLPQQSPPAELAGVDPAVVGNANGGYVMFGISARHVNGPHKELVLWSMVTFYFVVSYHVKSCKAMMHTRMRAKVTDMVGVLKAAQDTQHDPDVRRTVSGRLIRVPGPRAAAPPPTQPVMRQTGLLPVLMQL